MTCFCQDTKKSNIFDIFSKSHRALYLPKMKRNSEGEKCATAIVNKVVGF